MMHTVFTCTDATEDTLDVDTFDHMQGVMFTCQAGSYAGLETRMISVVVQTDELRELVRVLSIELDVLDRGDIN